MVLNGKGAPPGPIEYAGPLDLNGPARSKRFDNLLAETIGAAAVRLGKGVSAEAFGLPEATGRTALQAEWRPPSIPVEDEASVERIAPDEVLRCVLALHESVANPRPRAWDATVDPYRVGWLAVAEAAGRYVAGGGTPASLLLYGRLACNRLDQPDSLGGLVRCALGCADAADAHGALFVGGEVAVEEVEGDGRGAVTVTLLDAPAAGARRIQPGNFLFAVGMTRPELGGSDFARVGGAVRPQHRAAPRPAAAPFDALRAVAGLLGDGLARSCVACGPGGLAVALAAICHAGNIGAEAQLGFVPVDPWYAYAADDAILFAESPGRFLVEVAPGNAAALPPRLGNVPHACFAVPGGDALRVHPRLPGAADPVLFLPVR